MPVHSLKPFFKTSIFSNFYFVFGVYFLLVLFASTRILVWEGSNNYSIFYYSLYHLIEAKSLYALYPAQYEDHYHYAPAFAVLFAPIFALPYSIGLFLWQFLFAGIWVYAVYKLPITDKQKVFAYWFCLHELFTSLVNSQTNPLIAAISLFTFLSLERRQPLWAAFFIVLGANIKIYSLVAGALFLLYPQKIRFLGYCFMWAVVLAVVPLLFTSPQTLWWQYEQWVKQLLIKSDGDKWLNISIHRLVHLVISPDIATSAIIGAGVLVFCTVYTRVSRFKELTFRLLMVASVLLFQVIFNPVSESPTYITAVTGVMCWWFCTPQNWLDRILLVACFILTVMSPSDLFPSSLREQFVKPYVLKALPCVLIWFRVIYLMLLPAKSSVHYLRPEPV